VGNSQKQQSKSIEFLIKSDKRATVHFLWLTIGIKKKAISPT
jgi:hypothetical protein